MNNQDPGNPNNRSITLFSTNGQLVTPEQYVQNQRRISDVVQLAQALTSRNDAGLMRYMEEQRRKVTEGLAAAHALQTMNAVVGNSNGNPLDQPISLMNTTLRKEASTSFVDPWMRTVPLPNNRQSAQDSGYIQQQAGNPFGSASTYGTMAAPASGGTVYNSHHMHHPNGNNAAYSAPRSDSSIFTLPNQSWAPLTSAPANSNVQSSSAPSTSHFEPVQYAAQPRQVQPQYRVSDFQKRDDASQEKSPTSGMYLPTNGTINPAFLTQNPPAPISQSQRATAIANYNGSTLSNALNAPTSNDTNQRQQTWVNTNQQAMPAQTTGQFTSRSVSQTTTSEKDIPPRPPAPGPNLSAFSSSSAVGIVGSPMRRPNRSITESNGSVRSQANARQQPRTIAHPPIHVPAHNYTQPSNQRTVQVSAQSTVKPIVQPAGRPVPQTNVQPTAQPSVQPSIRPQTQTLPQPVTHTTQTANQPTSRPTAGPVIQYTNQPVAPSTTLPSGQAHTQSVQRPINQPPSQARSPVVTHPPTAFPIADSSPFRYYARPSGGTSSEFVGLNNPGTATNASMPTFHQFTGSSLFAQYIPPVTPTSPELTATITEVTSPPAPSPKSPTTTHPPRPVDRTRLAASILRELIGLETLEMKRAGSGQTDGEVTKKQKTGPPPGAEVIDVDSPIVNSVAGRAEGVPSGSNVPPNAEVVAATPLQSVTLVAPVAISPTTALPDNTAMEVDAPTKAQTLDPPSNGATENVGGTEKEVSNMDQDTSPPSDTGDIDIFADADEHISTIPSTPPPQQMVQTVFTIDPTSVFAQQQHQHLQVRDFELPPIAVLQMDGRERDENIGFGSTPVRSGAVVPGGEQVDRTFVTVSSQQQSQTTSQPTPTSASSLALHKPPIVATTPVPSINTSLPPQGVQFAENGDTVDGVPTSIRPPSQLDGQQQQHEQQPLFLPDFPSASDEFPPAQPWDESGGRGDFRVSNNPDSASTAPSTSTGAASSNLIPDHAKLVAKSISNSFARKRKLSSALADRKSVKGGMRPSGARLFVEVPYLSAAEKARYRVDKRQNGARVAEPEIVEVEESDIEQVVTNKGDEQRQTLAKLMYEKALEMLQSRKCLWRGCESVFNCANRLTTHVVLHVDKENKGHWAPRIYNCQWEGCVRRFREPGALEHHLRNHVLRTVFCIVQGCDERFSTRYELVSHVETNHHLSDPKTIPKPSARTMGKMVEKSIPSIPETMPAYASVRQPVRPSPMDRQKHAELGAWVFRQAFGPIALVSNKEKLKGRKSSQSFGTSEGTEAHSGLWRKGMDQYDFLRTDGVCGRKFSYLPSAEVSDLVEQGVLLFAEDTAFKCEDVGGIVISDGRGERNDQVTETAETSMPPTTTTNVEAMSNSGGNVAVLGRDEAAVRHAPRISDREDKEESDAVEGLV